MILINDPFCTDYHIHTVQFSDGIDTMLEICRHLGNKLNYKEIAFMDHSEASAKLLHWPRASRYSVKHWKNIENDINVIIGVEADLLNENGDICDHIQDVHSDFLALSAHEMAYKGDHKKVSLGLANALDKYHKKIKFVSHLNAYFHDDMDIPYVAEVANHYGIPLELNGKYFEKNKKRFNEIVNHAERLIINSDAHTAAAVHPNKIKIYNYLKQNFNSLEVSYHTLGRE